MNSLCTAPMVVLCSLGFPGPLSTSRQTEESNCHWKSCKFREIGCLRKASDTKKCFLNDFVVVTSVLNNAGTQHIITRQIARGSGYLQYDIKIMSFSF